MKPIKLNTVLISLVAVAGLCALIVSSFIALYKSDQESKAHAHQISEVVKQQLDWQLLKVKNHAMAPESFPNFYLWKHSNNLSDLCISFQQVSGEVTRSLCAGGSYKESWPTWFEQFHSTAFGPELELRSQINSEVGINGVFIVTTNSDARVHRAWNSVLQLMEFSALTALTLSLLIYVALRRILAPLKQTQQTLKAMQQGDLSIRVPSSLIQEWDQTSMAINNLATTLKTTLDERKELSYKLLHVQESERRYLCRELHDDMGQYLTGLRAIAHYIHAETVDNHPDIADKANKISHISEEMMHLVKDLLFRLRPADLDELGIAENTRSLIKEWNTKHLEKHCRLNLQGPIERTPSAVAVNLLRVIQESLTNVVKHTSASTVEITLIYQTTPSLGLMLCIEDNGKMIQPDALTTSGNGLLGVKERISALNGELVFGQSTLGGLKVSAFIPLRKEKDCKENDQYFASG